jgi:hypothetical protein
LLKQLARNHDVERGDRARIMSFGADAAILAGGSPAATPGLIAHVCAFLGFSEALPLVIHSKRWGAVRWFEKL